MKTKKSSTEKNKIICSQCGAVYTKLPAYTCPRCGAVLCVTGCEGCTMACPFHK